MKTTMKFTKYERARIIGARALQIAMGAPILLKTNEEFFEEVSYNPVAISKREFEAGVLPITIKRPLPGKKN